MGSVGVIVNPWAGKDIRRLHAPVGHTPDTAKIGVVRKIVIGALDAGADRVLVCADVGRIAGRAIDGLDGAELIDGPGTGSPLDTQRGAAQLAELGCRPIIVLGGDGTCRDATIGAPDAVMIPISTGTNNVFPRFVDASSAGTAAGFLAAGRVPIDAVGYRAKVLHVSIGGDAADDASADDSALVDVAVTTATRTGARAVLHPDSITAVVAAIATPASTGLSSIAGRVHPLDRRQPGAIAITLGGPRQVRVPLMPGAYDVVGVDTITELAEGESFHTHGPATLAYDGERQRVVAGDATITVTVRTDGPFIIDVERTLHCAATQGLFDVDTLANPASENLHGN